MVDRYGKDFEVKKAEFVLEAIKFYTVTMAASEHNTEELIDNIIMASEAMQDGQRSLEYHKERAATTSAIETI